MPRLAPLIIAGILTVGALSLPGMEPLIEYKLLFDPRPADI